MKIEQSFYPVDKAIFITRYIRDRVLNKPRTVVYFSTLTGNLFNTNEPDDYTFEVMYYQYPIYDQDEYVGYVDTYGFHFKEVVE